jgi:hypothetical protein
LLDKEIFTDVTSGERHEADFVVKVKFRAIESFFLIHVENQAHPQAEFSRRMFRYFARLYEKHELPVYPVAIFSYDLPKREEPSNHKVEFPDLLVLDFNFRAIQLNRLNWRDYISRQNPVASALMAKMNFSEEERPRVKLECLRLLATLKLDPARTQLISGFIDTYLRLNAEEELKLRWELEVIDPIEREGIMEIVTSWMEQGIQQGLERGRQQEAAALVLKLVARKMGALEPALEEQIRALPVAQLESLAEALLNFTNKTELAAWLQQNG